MCGEFVITAWLVTCGAFVIAGWFVACEAAVVVAKNVQVHLNENMWIVRNGIWEHSFVKLQTLKILS